MAANTNQLHATFGCVDKSSSAKGSVEYKIGNTTFTRTTSLLTFNKSETIYLPDISITFSIAIRIYIQNRGSNNQVLVYNGNLWGSPYVSTGFTIMGTSNAPSIGVYPIPADNVMVPPLVMPPLVAPPIVTTK